MADDLDLLVEAAVAAERARIRAQEKRPYRTIKRQRDLAASLAECESILAERLASLRKLLSNLKTDSRVQGDLILELASPSPLVEAILSASPRLEVIVENVGVVYDGADRDEAERVYDQYVQKSKDGDGRTGGCSVALIVDDEAEKNHIPYVGGEP